MKTNLKWLFVWFLFFAVHYSILTFIYFLPDLGKTFEDYFFRYYDLIDVFYYTIMFIIIMMVYNIKGSYRLRYNALTWQVLICLTVIAISIFIIESTIRFLQFSKLSVDFSNETFHRYSSRDIPSILIGSVKYLIMAPIVEELFFRKLFFDSFSKRINTLSLIIISGATFSLIHLGKDFIGFINVFISGVFLATLYVKKQSILLCIVLHSLLNFLFVIINYFIPSFRLKIFGFFTDEMYFYLLLVGAFILLALIWNRWLNKEESIDIQN